MAISAIKVGQTFSCKEKKGESGDVKTGIPQDGLYTRTAYRSLFRSILIDTRTFRSKNRSLQCCILHCIHRERDQPWSHRLTPRLQVQALLHRGSIPTRPLFALNRSIGPRVLESKIPARRTRMPGSNSQETGTRSESRGRSLCLRNTVKCMSRFQARRRRSRPRQSQESRKR